MTEQLTHLEAGQAIVWGGNKVARVPDDLAAAFKPGDRLVVVHETGALLHIPRADHQIVDTAVGAAADAFAALAHVGDDQISAFFDGFAVCLAADEVFEPIASANAADVAEARRRGRATGRLELTPAMRAGMVDGLRSWRDSTTRRAQHVGTIRHEGWSVETWRDPLGVVGFVFEGRPNVFADATGVLRTGNTVVFRIGSDALRTAQAIMQVAVEPALSGAGLPLGAVQLVDAPARAAGWALFSDARLSLAVARGSGAAVAELGAVARQHGVPASLHGTGGAWLVADATAHGDAFAAAVQHSLDRKVCNTLNVCCIVAARAGDLMPAFRHAVVRVGAARGVVPIVHELTIDDPRLAQEWEWDDVPEVAVVVVDDVDQAVAAFNRCSPRLVASLISSDAAAHDAFYAAVDAPFVGDGFTRWVDGQFALDQPELGLSNWQSGRLFGRGAVLSGDSVHTIRLRARISDVQLHR